MRSIDFFETHPLFTHRAFLEARAAHGSSPGTANNLLAKHLAAGRIVRVRRGLYATVPRGVEPNQADVDPYLIATQLAPDAVVAYHAALQFHGKVYSLWSRFHYVTHRRARRFSFREMAFVPVQMTGARGTVPGPGQGVIEGPHAGGLVRVTTLERSLVDVLHAPNRAGGWEEVWRSLEMVEFFDLDAVVEHVRQRDSALTAARVGFFLDQHQEDLMVEEEHLAALQGMAPRQPRYLDATHEKGRLVPRWNLIVPKRVLDRSWQEVA